MHPSARHDPLDRVAPSRVHRAAAVGGLVALAAFPVYLACAACPSPLEVLIFAWLATPDPDRLLPVAHRQYERAHMLSSLALTGLVTSDRSGDRRHQLVRRDLAGGRAARGGAVGLAPRRVAGVRLRARRRGAALSRRTAGSSPRSRLRPALMALGIISAALYATGLALGSASLARTSFWLLYAEEDRYRLLARNMTDVITRHGATARCCSPRRRPKRCSACRRNRCSATACSIACTWPIGRPISPRWRMPARSGESSSVEFRVRREVRRTRPANSPVHLGRDALPPARSRRRRDDERARGGRGDARRHRAQGAGAGARGRARGGRARQRRQEPLPRDHEPRAAHAAQRHHRLLRDAR